ncbi:putative enzyme related to lactoylglutathione lyase [Streptomonospora nanhaiensis]|uniref:Putative enzyme related to lactoylglutathione lyase n=1 Tax=Streptomonospora nanhaiensis TaxID=1323731 RepID=A0A853BS13_9ACTN|nr:VOC family protein [Streptomonospora nanhaiensis]NYI98178.1 putative enzyme related to lactoylglutathione lyase [Streptomonospora nanhaiensis]
MLADSTAYSGFAVDDTAAAAAFYRDTLGLTVEPVPGMEEHGLLALRLPGGAQVLVYPKPDFTPAAYTVLNFAVEDIDEAVDGLAARGVAFLRSPGFDQDGKGIARARGGGPSIAWFTDPAGNILSVLQEP